MIRINLLGVPKARKGKRAASVSTPSEGPSAVLVGLVIFALTAGVVFYLYKQADKQHDDLTNDMAKANSENQRLSNVKATYEKTQKEAAQFQRRVDVINQLTNAKTGPVDFLNKVATTINSTDAVWLQAMTDDGRSIDFTGMALSPNAVADLMVNLQKTGLFKSVEIKETSQDAAVKEMQAFKFELICEKAAAQPQQPQTPQAPGQTKADNKKA
jgi:Tfp pilus assembly protein PilN